MYVLHSKKSKYLYLKNKIVRIQDYACIRELVLL